MRKNNTKQQQTKKTKSRKTEKQSKIKNNLDKILTTDCNFFFLQPPTTKIKQKQEKFNRKKELFSTHFVFYCFLYPIYSFDILLPLFVIFVSIVISYHYYCFAICCHFCFVLFLSGIGFPLFYYIFKEKKNQKIIRY